jgi:hypothetical protein
MPRIKCPHCNHKLFKTENGLKWHLDHIHGKVKYGSGISMKPRPDSELQETDGNQQNLQNFKREIEERVNSRLSIFTKRDAWLSDRISELELRLGRDS